MKKFLSIVIAILMVAVPAYAFASNQKADDTLELKTSNTRFEADSVLEKIGEIEYKTAIVIDGEQYDLFPEFKNIEITIGAITDMYRDVLSDMQELYGLKDFDKDSVEMYYSKFVEYIQYEKDIYGEDLPSCIYELNEFFDIYENTEANNDIISKIELLNKCTDIETRKDIAEEIVLSMPYISIRAGFEETLMAASGFPGVSVTSYNGNSSFVVSSGVTYANAHATSPYTTKYSSCLADCTNFASQIKHEGGVPRYKTYGESGAWTYKVVSNTTYPTLNYSPRWCNANSFATFFGVKNSYSASSYASKYTAFVNLASNVNKGSFIAFDETADGDWDHIGFVNALYHSGESTRRSISYHGTTYKDFKVAQHTSNYNAWVSSSDNSWEKLPENYSHVVLGIVY